MSIEAGISANYMYVQIFIFLFSPPKPLRGFNIVYRQIFALDSAVVKMCSSHGGFLTYEMHHHRETIKSKEL